MWGKIKPRRFLLGIGIILLIFLLTATESHCQTKQEILSRSAALLVDLEPKELAYSVHVRTGISRNFLDVSTIEDITLETGTALGLEADKIEIDVLQSGQGYRTYYLGGEVGSERVQLITQSTRSAREVSAQEVQGTQIQAVISGRTDSPAPERISRRMVEWKSLTEEVLSHLVGSEDVEVRWRLNGFVPGYLDREGEKLLLSGMKRELEVEIKAGRIENGEGVVHTFSPLLESGYTLELEDRSREINCFLSLDPDPEKNRTRIGLGTASGPDL